MNTGVRHRSTAGRPRLRPTGLAVTATALALGASACSPTPPAKEYETPTSLCGKTVEAERLDPFLPPGSEVSLHSTGSEASVEYCRLEVDGKEVLSFSIEWRRKGTGLRQAAGSVVGLRGRDEIGLGGDGEKVTTEPLYLYSRTGGVAKVACAEPRKEEMEPFVSARVGEGKTPGAAEMKKLIAAYAKAVGKSDECT